MSNLMVNENKRTSITLVTSIFALVLTILINFFLTPYIVQTLGEEANGFTQLATNFVNAASLITLALNSMAGRFVLINYHKGDIDESKKYYSSIMIANIALILFMIIPASIMIFKLENIINITTENIFPVKLLFSFVFVNFFVAQINSVLNIATYVTNKQYYVNIINLVKTILHAICLIFFFSVFVPQMYYVSFVAMFLSVLTIPIYLIIGRKILPELKVSFKYFRIKLIVNVLLSGIWNVVIHCGNLLMTGVDLILANLLLGPTAMGVLSVSKVMPTCLSQLGGNVNSSFSPNLSIAYASGEKNNVVSSLRYAMKCSSILMCLPVMVLCVFGESFYALWQPTLNAGQLAILSVCACIQFIPFAGPQVLNNSFTAANKLKLNALSVLAAGIVNIVVVILGIKYTNIDGLILIAVVSSIISIIRNLVITVPYSARILNLKWNTFYKDVLISCLCCIVCGLFCWLFSLLIVPKSWVRLIVSVFCACILSLVSLYYILLNKEERETLIKKFRRKNNG